MEAIIILGLCIGIAVLIGMAKEVKNQGDILHNWRNDWEKVHGREMNRNGIYEDTEDIRERVGGERERLED